MRTVTVGRVLGLHLWLLPALPAAAQSGAALATPAAESVAVRTATVIRGTVIDTLQIIGSLVASRDAAISAATSGNLTAVAISSGQAVKAGDLLFQLDDRAARAELEVQQAKLRVAENALRRAQDLARSGNMPAARLDELTSDHATANAQFHAAQARLELLSLRASFDGQVGIVRHSPGAFVQVGEQLVRLADNTRILADFQVSQSHLREIRIGQPFTVSGDALGTGGVLEGRISVIDFRADRNTRAVEVQGELRTDGAALPTGIAVRVAVELDRRENRVLVPQSALVPGMVSDQAWRIEEGVARLVRVQVGSRHEGRAEVVSGLKEGDQVVTVGQFRLRDGTPVEVVPDGAPSSVTAAPVAGR
jgi:membrane fusion protein (multidrug efflux system)